MTYRCEFCWTEFESPALRQFFGDRSTQTLSKRAVGDQLRALGVNYRDKTISDALERLAADRVLTATNGPRGSRLFALAGDAKEEPDALAI